MVQLDIIRIQRRDWSLEGKQKRTPNPVLTPCKVHSTTGGVPGSITIPPNYVHRESSREEDGVDRDGGVAAKTGGGVVGTVAAGKMLREP